MKIKIYYHHTDCGGVVYYANYLSFLEEARTEFFEECGVSIRKLTEEGVLFVVARQEVDYKLPAVYGDTLEIKAWITTMSRVKVEFEYDVRNQKGEVIICAKTIMVCVDRNVKPRSLPEDVREKISQKNKIR